MAHDPLDNHVVDWLFSYVELGTILASFILDKGLIPGRLLRGRQGNSEII